MTKDIIIVADYTEEITLTDAELCEICGIEAIQLNDLIAYEILLPRGKARDNLLFDMDQLIRLRKALRLQRDLEVNYAGIALVMDLLEELEELRATKTIYLKHTR